MTVETGFCEGGRKKSCPLKRVSVKEASTVQVTPDKRFLGGCNLLTAKKSPVSQQRKEDGGDKWRQDRPTWFTYLFQWSSAGGMYSGWSLSITW